MVEGVLSLSKSAGSTGFCFVHAADVHLDSPFSSMRLDSPEAAEAFAGAARASLAAIARVCIEEGADFLALSGDVFDSEQRSLRAQHELWMILGELAERGVHTYVAFGNHDSLSGWRSAFSWPEGVHFFGPEVSACPVVVNGREVARVSGVSYSQPSVADNLSLAFRKDPNDPFTVGVLHCNVGGDMRHANYAPCTLADLEASGIDYWALGHVHEPRVLRAESPAIVYAGCAQGRNPREAGAHGCFVVRAAGGDGGGGVGGGRVEMKFVPTDVIRWHVLDVMIDGMSTVDQLIDAIRAGVARLAMSSNMRSCAFRVRLLGRGRVHRELAVDGPEALLAAAREASPPGDRFDWIECVQDLTGPDVDRDALKAGGSLISDLLCLADETRSDPARVAAVRGALEQRLGSRAGRGLTRLVRELNDEEMLRIIAKAESLALDLLLEEADL